MCFEIHSTISPDFSEGESLFVPSWQRNSGAARITIHRIAGQSWYENIILRNQVIRDVITANRKRLLFLDIDCFILRNVSDGFDGRHPIAVARWRQPNMGVLFLDGTLSFDWAGFFAPLILRIVRRCRNPRTWGDLSRKGRFGDQYPWHDALRRVEPAVRKLDMNQWNFCHQPEDWARELSLHKHEVRIVHVKGRGRWEQQPRIKAKIDLVRKLFPDKIQE